MNLETFSFKPKQTTRAAASEKNKIFPNTLTTRTNFCDEARGRNIPRNFFEVVYEKKSQNNKLPICARQWLKEELQIIIFLHYLNQREMFTIGNFRLLALYDALTGKELHDRASLQSEICVVSKLCNNILFYLIGHKSSRLLCLFSSSVLDFPNEILLGEKVQ